MKAHFLEIKNIVHIKYFVGIIVCCSWTLINLLLNNLDSIVIFSSNMRHRLFFLLASLKMANAQVSQLLMQRYSHIPPLP